jgi:hypothetical protein
MALKIYPDTTSGTPFTQEGVMTNPLRESFDGRTGEVKEIKYYLRNDNAAVVYSGITVQALSISGRDIVNGTDGYSWKLKAVDIQPTTDEWRAVTVGASISLGSTISIATYLPFWVKIEVPRGAPVSSYEGLVLRISATETSV